MTEWHINSAQGVIPTALVVIRYFQHIFVLKFRSRFDVCLVLQGTKKPRNTRRADVRTCRVLKTRPVHESCRSWATTTSKLFTLLLCFAFTSIVSAAVTQSKYTAKNNCTGTSIVPCNAENCNVSSVNVNGLGRIVKELGDCFNRNIPLTAANKYFRSCMDADRA